MLQFKYLLYLFLLFLKVNSDWTAAKKLFSGLLQILIFLQIIMSLFTINLEFHLIYNEPAALLNITQSDWVMTSCFHPVGNEPPSVYSWWHCCCILTLLLLILQFRPACLSVFEDEENSWWKTSEQTTRVIQSNKILQLIKSNYSFLLKAHISFSFFGLLAWDSSPNNKSNRR